MKASFVSFWRKSIAAGRLAILNHLEYRLNFFVDAYCQPIITTLVEVALWIGIWTHGNFTSLNGFGFESYMAYAIWATFVSRITTNWQYEMTMMDDIETGRLNAILLRPFSFYSFYLSQFFGYKLSVVVGTLGVPLLFSLLFDLPVHIERIPLAVGLLIFYVWFAHTLSFLVACFCFFMTRAQSLTAAKNIALWVLSGELFPLDLIPGEWGRIAMLSPFASGAYTPVAFIIGRVGLPEMITAFQSVGISLILAGLVAHLMWRAGIRNYVGTGA